MSILRLIFEGYSKTKNSFATCILLIQENVFTYSSAYRVAEKEGYFVCSEMRIDRLIEERCKKEGGDFWYAFMTASNKGHYFINFDDKRTSGFNPFNVPRFSEEDFEEIITTLGGTKIPESTIKTPDFKLNEDVYELKDIQSEGLYNKDRRQNIAKAFENCQGHFIDLDPSQDYGEASIKYQQLIKGTVQTHFRKASEQIKSYKYDNGEYSSAGLILLNTGMFSLSHEMLKGFVQDLIRKSSTIEFALLFSQIMQGSWFDLYAVYANEIIGKETLGGSKIKEAAKKLIDKKMTLMVRGEKFESIIESMHPISFEAGNKIFYWNPGRIKSTLPTL